MRDGQPSHTAQRVAAYRRGLNRAPAPFGDPAADDALAADAAAASGPPASAAMTRYLQARTAFFDRVTLGALERGARQLVVVGAGYDGRALRYAKPGTRWFEVDHPATQDDKRARLRRLGTGTGHITFIPADLRDPGLAGALTAAGFEPDAPAAMLCEGVAAYLDAEVFWRLLAELRAVATAGTRLAFSASPPEPASQERREQLAVAVAAAGEPIRSTLTGQDLARLLGRARWRPVQRAERSRQLGFFVAAPEWEAAGPAQPRTVGQVGAYLERTFSRAGTDGLADHLAEAHGAETDRLARLDVGVYRAELCDGRRLAVRVFGAGRPPEAARAEAALLRFLAAAGFPAERCAGPQPVSEYLGQAVLVTEWVPGRKPPPTQETFRALGDLLGRLALLDPPPELKAHPGGAWHHLATGPPGAETAAAAALLAAARPRVSPAGQPGWEAVAAELAAADTADGLPCALVHPDVVPVNAMIPAAPPGPGRQPDAARREPAGDAPPGLVLLDWAGAGYGPRLWPLAFLLSIAGRHGLRHAEAAAAGYRAHLSLEPDEAARLPDVLYARPLVLDAWAAATGRTRFAEVAGGLAAAREAAAAIADRAGAVLAGPGPDD